jgi:hypothetical protein
MSYPGRDSLAKLDGNLYVVNDDTDSREPVRRRLWWPVLATEGYLPCWFEPESVDGGEFCQLCGQRNTSVSHSSVTPDTLRLGGYDGRYGGTLSNGARFYVRIDPRGQAVKIEETPIPCPKVRAGMETRFERGSWQKYLKAQGWVAV